MRTGATAQMRFLQGACLTIPLVVLAGSYVWLSVDHGTLVLWDVRVHESGRRTLGETVLYFAHFLREVPVDIAYALFLIAASGKLTEHASHRGAARSRRLARLCSSAAAALVLGALLVTASSAGWGSAARDLFQFRTRDDLVAYGSHWRFHWLSTLWFGAIVGLAPVLIAWATDRTAIVRTRTWDRVAWGYFVVATMVFGLSSEVFADIRYVGHQAREIMTHGPVTALLGLAVVLAAHARLGSRKAAHTRRFARADWIRLGVAFAVPVYLITVALRGELMEAGQSDQGLAAMVAAHYFEHVLDYIFVCLLLLAGLGLRAARRPPASPALQPSLVMPSRFPPQR